MRIVRQYEAYLCQGLVCQTGLLRNYLPDYFLGILSKGAKPSNTKLNHHQDLNKTFRRYDCALPTEISTEASMLTIKPGSIKLKLWCCRCSTPTLSPALSPNC